MKLLSYVKAYLILLAEWLTERFEPYKLSRWPLASGNLGAMADDFYVRLPDFTIRGGTIVQSRIPLDPKLPHDLGDQAIWHGYATAMQAIRFYREPSAANKATLSKFIVGLADQQPSGVLIRGIDDDGRIQEDASNDSATGHLVGLYFAYIFGDHDHSARATELIGEWASDLLDHGYTLTNLDGTPTTYGALEQGWKSDPLRITLLLAILALAWTATHDEAFNIHYNALWEKYSPLVRGLPFRFFGLEKYPDLHRGAMHLYILANLRSDRSPFLPGLAAYARLAQYQGNVLMAILCTPAILPDWNMIGSVLSTFSVVAKDTNPGRQLSSGWPDKKKWAGQWVSTTPIPKWQKRTQDYEWARHPYSLDSGLEGQEADSRFNGSDFLFAYYFAVLYGLLK